MWTLRRGLALATIPVACAGLWAATSSPAGAAGRKQVRHQIDMTWTPVRANVPDGGGDQTDEFRGVGKPFTRKTQIFTVTPAEDLSSDEKNITFSMQLFVKGEPYVIYGRLGVRQRYLKTTTQYQTKRYRGEGFFKPDPKSPARPPFPYDGVISKFSGTVTCYRSGRCTGGIKVTGYIDY